MGMGPDLIVNVHTFLFNDQGEETGEYTFLRFENALGTDKIYIHLGDTRGRVSLITLEKAVEALRAGGSR